MIAVVDAYDAMTNNRSYRLAMPVERAVEELKRCAGSQFDPFIVSEFLRMLREEPQEPRPNEPDPGSHDGKPGVSMPIDIVGETGNNVHQVPFARYILDENMRIVSVDEEFERLTGYSAEDIRQRTILQTDLIPEEERT